MLQGLTRALGRGATWPFRTVAYGMGWAVRATVAVFRGIGHGIAQFVNSIIDVIAAIFNAIGNGIAWVIHPVLHGISSAIRGLANGFTLIAHTIFRGISQAIRRAMGAVGEATLMLRKATVTLSIEEGAIRVVVFRGHRVVGWDNVNLAVQSDESDPKSPPSDVGATKLRDLLADLMIRRSQVVTDLPLYAPLMRHLHLPNISGRYLEPTIVSEVLESIPFGADEVDISWHRQRSGSGQEVVAVAVPKENINGQVRLARGAGLTPKAAYSKASALALAAGFPDAIVIHLQPLEAEVVLVHSGSPRVVHQLAMPRDASHIQDSADTLVAAVEQVVGYYQSLDPQVDSGTLPVVMTGQTAEESELVEVLTRTLGREVLPFAPDLRLPAEFPTGVYAANLGLYLAYTAKGNPRGRGSAQMVPALNLLPERHLPQNLLPPQAFFAFLILVLLAAVVFPITTQVEGIVRSVAEKDSLLENLKIAEGLYDEEKTDAGSSQEELLAVIKQSEALQSLLVEFETDIDILLDRMRLVTDTAKPVEVQLSSLSPESGGYALSGTAPSHDVILTYAGNLRSSDLFTDANVVQVTGSESGALSFRIQTKFAEEDLEEDAKP